MRGEGTSLDLNNFPEEYGQEAFDGSSPSTEAKSLKKQKKSGGKDDSYRVYECRFCSLRFCKSQALGGHMNRHRQEREVETLHRARQLVFSNEGLAAAGACVHLGVRDNYGVSISHAIPWGYFQHGVDNNKDPCLQLEPVYRVMPTHCPSLSNPYLQTHPTHHPSIVGNFAGHAVRERSQNQLHHQHANGNVFTGFGVPLADTTQMEGATGGTKFQRH